MLIYKLDKFSYYFFIGYFHSFRSFLAAFHINTSFLFYLSFMQVVFTLIVLFLYVCEDILENCFDCIETLSCFQGVFMFIFSSFKLRFAQISYFNSYLDFETVNFQNCLCYKCYFLWQNYCFQVFFYLFIQIVTVQLKFMIFS